MSIFARLFSPLLKLVVPPEFASTINGVVDLMRSDATPMGNVQAGDLVTITGRVETIESTMSPLLQIRGAGFHLRADRRHPRRHHNGPPKRRWQLLHEEQDFRDFWLVDDSGNRAFIEARNVLCVFKGYGTPAKERVDGFLKARNVTGRWDRALEFVVTHGAAITVRGEVVIEADPNAELKPHGYRGSERPTRIRITPKNDLLIVSDWIPKR